jgi:hypothetical protein
MLFFGPTTRARATPGISTTIRVANTSAVVASEKRRRVGDQCWRSSARCHSTR